MAKLSSKTNGKIAVRGERIPSYLRESARAIHNVFGSREQVAAHCDGPIRNSSGGRQR